MNELTESSLARDLNSIDACINVDEIIQYLNKLDTVKYLLDKERRFRENAVKFATLHVAALVRIAVLGGASEISNARVRKTAEWLARLTDEERAAYIARCADGATIDYIWKKEIEEPRLAEAKAQRNIEKAQTVVSDAISTVKAVGVVDTAKCVEKINALLPDNPKLARDITNGMRNRLLDSGAIGVGFDSGLYITPIPSYEAYSGDIDSKEADYWRNIRSAIMNRFRSISADLRKLHSIIEQSKINLEYDNFISDSSISHDCINFYDLCITLMMADMGLISKERLEDKLDRSFEYRKHTRRSASDYKSGREYFVGELAKAAKRELELHSENESFAKSKLDHLPLGEEEKRERRRKDGLMFKEVRTKAGLTQKELAEKVGINSEYLSMIECGKKSASYELTKKIFDVC